MNIRELLERGHAARGVVKKAKEAAVLGHPRVGSVGILTEGGEVFGLCHRKAFARSLGIEDEIGLHTRIMFGAGEANEHTWLQVLGQGEHNLLTGDDCVIKAKIDGVEKELLGHPDIVFADDAGKPTFGLELKGVFGYSTAASVWFEGRPKNENLIQTATYSHFLKIPFALWYTSSSYIPVNYHDQKKYGQKTILPFYRGFSLEWQNGRLAYRSELETDWTVTEVTGKTIEDYYRLVAEMGDKKDLWKRPSANYLDGTPNKWGKDSDCKFCPFSAACEEYEIEADFDAWITNITEGR